METNKWYNMLLRYFDAVLPHRLLHHSSLISPCIILCLYTLCSVALYQHVAASIFVLSSIKLYFISKANLKSLMSWLNRVNRVYFPLELLLLSFMARIPQRSLASCRCENVPSVSFICFTHNCNFGKRSPDGNWARQIPVTMWYSGLHIIHVPDNVRSCYVDLRYLEAVLRCLKGIYLISDKPLPSTSPWLKLL